MISRLIFITFGTIHFCKDFSVYYFFVYFLFDEKYWRRNCICIFIGLQLYKHFGTFLLRITRFLNFMRCVYETKRFKDVCWYNEWMTNKTLILHITRSKLSPNYMFQTSQALYYRWFFLIYKRSLSHLTPINDEKATWRENV